MGKDVFCSGSHWQASSGFNLYIDISSACNASCAFCIAPTVGRKDGPKFFNGARFALDLTEKINGTVQIVGGEPMISRRLPELLKEIGMHTYRRVVLNTNGTGISDEKLSEMNLAGVTHVNVSRHHYDEQRNQNIMHLRPELPNAALASGIVRIKDSGIDVRMQCNLIREQIDSLQGVISYNKWSNDLGCKEVSFSQIFPLSLFDYQRPIEVGYTEKVQIDLRQLVADIDACSKFLPAPENYRSGDGMSPWGSSFWGSGARRRFWFGPEDTRFSLKTLSGYDKSGLPKKTAYNKKDDWELQDGVLAFAVLHSDGTVTASWDRRERQLFNQYASAHEQRFEVLESSPLPQPRMAGVVVV